MRREHLTSKSVKFELNPKTMLKQSLQQKLLQKLSPQQIQLMKLLQIPSIELESRIKEELEVNPALEEGKLAEQDDADNYEDDTRTESEKEFELDDYWDDDTPAYKSQVNNYSKDQEFQSAPIAVGKSLRDFIAEQLDMRDLDDVQRQIGELIVGNLDDSGYLRRDTKSIVDDLIFNQNIEVSEEDVLEILFMIQDFDPPGTGARDLQECLIIQLEKKPESDVINMAIKVLEKCFDAFSKKHYTKIEQRLHLEPGELKAALDEVLKLNPKPGAGYNPGGSVLNQQINPEFLIVENHTGEQEVKLFKTELPALRVSETYKNMLKGYKENPDGVKDKEAVQFVKQKLDGAAWFIDAIRQRQMTLLGTMQAIFEIQREFFSTGDEAKLKPMILRDVAEKVNLDISTISRVANSKYIQTPYGNYLLKYFFSEALTSSDGEQVSSREVKAILDESIAGEDKKKPLTDQKLMAVLEEKGYNIARRTVAKYREQLGIPVARLRKEL
ncbi:MAG: RNA polymerase sigma-54 factor [Luteibaculaceae bacterium]